MSSWRADTNGQYWHVGSDGNVHPDIDQHDPRQPMDEARYEAGNYFVSQAAATPAAKWFQAGLLYINGHASMDAAIGWMIEARRTIERLQQEGGE